MAPAILAPFVAQRVVAWGLVEVTDPVALRNAGATPAPGVSWSSILIVAAVVGALYRFRDSFSSHTMLEVAIGTLVLTVATLHWLRRQAVRRQRAVFGISDTPDDTPIVPR